MDSTQIMNRPTPEDDDLGQATVRELIVKLARIEDELRTTTDPELAAALTQREREIVLALRQNRPSLNEPDNPIPPEASMVTFSVESTVAK